MNTGEREIVLSLYNENCKHNPDIWKHYNKAVSLNNGFKIICYLLSQKGRWRRKFGDIDPRKNGPRSKKWQSLYKYVEGLFEEDPRYARQYMDFVGDETADPAKAKAFAEAAGLHRGESLSISSVSQEDIKGPDVNSVKYKLAVR